MDDRCPYYATDKETTRTPREDGYRCGYIEGHVGNHCLFTEDGEGVLFAGGWSLTPPTMGALGAKEMKDRSFTPIEATLAYARRDALLEFAEDCERDAREAKERGNITEFTLYTVVAELARDRSKKETIR